MVITWTLEAERLGSTMVVLLFMSSVTSGKGHRSSTSQLLQLQHRGCDIYVTGAVGAKEDRGWEHFSNTVSDTQEAGT